MESYMTKKKKETLRREKKTLEVFIKINMVNG